MDVTDACLLSAAVTGHPLHPPAPSPFHPIAPNPLTSLTPGVRRRYYRSNARHVGTNLALPEVSDVSLLCTSCMNFCITPPTSSSSFHRSRCVLFFFKTEPIELRDIGIQQPVRKEGGG